MKIYKCKLCKKIFGNRKEARKHIREVHKIKGFSRRYKKGRRFGSSDITDKIESLDVS